MLAASFFWGAEYVVEKDILFNMGANYSNAIRFFVAGMICTVAMFPLLRQISKKDWHNGFLTGSMMGLGFSFQTMGLQYIDAGKNALLCASYILIIPFGEWILFRKYPGLRVFFYATLAMIGIVFITFNPSLKLLNFTIGEFLTLMGSIFYAAGIISIEKLTSETDPRILSLIQFYAITFVSIIFALILEDVPNYISEVMILEFAYLIIFSSIGAQLLMNYCMRFIKSSLAGIIFSTEALFAAVLGILFLNEPSSINLWVGIMLIVGSIAAYQAEFPQEGSPLKRIRIKVRDLINRYRKCCHPKTQHPSFVSTLKRKTRHSR